jgi:erythromycin esterase-like protein
MEAIGDSQFVLLGESTHGTAEYYAHRAAITKRLVETKGFSVVLIEGDWPAAYRVSRYISSEGSMDRSAHEALAGFAGFPSWMWKNERFASLVEELRAHNERVRAEGTEATATLSALGDLRAAGASEEQLEVMGFTKAAIAAASEGRPEVVLYGMDT